MPRSRAWMYIDETSNLGAGGTLEGASAIVVTKRGKRELARLKPRLEARFAAWGISPSLELHAERWVQRRELFPASCHPGIRIRALRDCLAAVASCRGVWLLHAMVDHSQPHPAGLDARSAIFEQLFLDFQVWLDRRMRGTVFFDRNAPGPVIAIHRWHRSRKHLPNLPIDPAPANSLDHFELRLADLCAYFVLQQSSLGAVQIRRAGAQNAIDVVANRNLLPAGHGGVRVVWL